MIDVTVEKITEHDDGTATIEMTMDENSLKFLAKVGMMTLIEMALDKEADGYPDTEGSDNAQARAERDQHLFGEIPGL